MHGPTLAVRPHKFTHVQACMRDDVPHCAVHHLLQYFQLACPDKREFMGDMGCVRPRQCTACALQLHAAQQDIYTLSAVVLMSVPCMVLALYASQQALAILGYRTPEGVFTNSLQDQGRHCLDQCISSIITQVTQVATPIRTRPLFRLELLNVQALWALQ